MGNHLLREYRCWDCHIAERCFCLPWKRIHIFKERQHSQKEDEGMSSAPIQENAEQTSSEELCYTLINHRVLTRRPSGNSAEGDYENVFPHAERPRESWGGTETEYSLLRVPSTSRLPPSPEAEYELLTPSGITPHSLQPPCLFMAPSQTQFSYL
ncbi:germinal center-associated signaling and motility protein isoform X2 [Choloepus didactylus]|uniref:germinal center-associated signaling and motility protein isoform X2 n=1 Tax=Choloepus didactylus TaxID=27675 RepID=UPI0001F9F6D6|nr:germinal center-associated signaling and motility protein isoform X2 [Choloepus didactylus]